MSLIYFPLESYKSRYTMQLSAPTTGWYERNWIKCGVDYIRVEGDPQSGEIISGQVLDAIGRSRWAMSQIAKLLDLLSCGKIKNTDVLFFDDFWHPGVEAFKYACDILGVRPRMYAYCWAQSVDVFDFTYPMRKWIRYFEQGNAELFDGIFVANTGLKNLLVLHGVATEAQVHVVGLPFCTEEVMERMPAWYTSHVTKDWDYQHRKNEVIFSSRWDEEKNPDFFIKVARTVFKTNPRIEFRVLSGEKNIRSNDPQLMELLREAVSDGSCNLNVSADLTKEEYYKILCGAKIQFNCADQDWTSFTLLEASVAGCYPLYPYFRSFPETLLRQNKFFYNHKDVEHAAEEIVTLIGSNEWTAEAIKKRSWIHKRFDGTWLRIAKQMQVETNTNFKWEKWERETAYPFDQSVLNFDWGA